MIDPRFNLFDESKPDNDYVAGRSTSPYLPLPQRNGTTVRDELERRTRSVLDRLWDGLAPGLIGEVRR